MATPTCCYIGPEEQEAAARGEKVRGCQERAEVAIYGEGTDPYSPVESCGRHVEALTRAHVRVYTTE